MDREWGVPAYPPVKGMRSHSRPNILIGLWACAAGAGHVAYWPRLPESSELPNAMLLALVAAGLLVIILGLGRRKPGPILAFVLVFALPFAIGGAWALKVNQQAMEHRLPPDLHGSDHSITVQISSLPQSAPAVSFFGAPMSSTSGYRDVRFRAHVLDADDLRFLQRELQLGWYRVAPEDAARLKAGSRWRMRVRLKQPRGSVNPYTFDYEAWLLEQGLFATGYVRDRDMAPVYLAPGGGMTAVRERIRTDLQWGAEEQPPYQQQALMRALLLGDRGGINGETRKLLQHTGTAHLLAISGLHVGMVAGCFFLLGSLIGRVAGLNGAGWLGNPVILAGFSALAGALGYTLLSGAPLSAQRAMVMAAVAIAALLLRRRFDGQLALAAAVCGILMWQPLAVLNAGFWLSFVAVAVLLLRFQGRVQVDQATEAERSPTSRAATLRSRRRVVALWVMNGVRSQWAILIGLLVPSIVIFHGVSLSGLLVNLVAIPWVGLSILPLILMGALSPFESLTSVLWTLADTQLGWLLAFLEYVDRLAPGWQPVPVFGHWIAALIVVSCLLLLLPRGLPGRWLGWLLFPVVAVGATNWQRPMPSEFALTVMDVGQGLAVTALTEDHALIFDTGASTGSGWSAGANIVAPYLQAQGRGRVDALVVSHGDRDHAGGVEGILETLDIDQLIAPGTLGHRLASVASNPQAATHAKPIRCVAGDQIRLGALEVQWLWPRSVKLDGEENDHSCVGLLTWGDARVLLTGDISSRVEVQLAGMYPEMEPVDLLIAPHHGSRTSSSSALIDWAQPARAVFSAGYRHRFGHPHPAVVSRYQKSGSELFNTAELGAVRFTWLPGAAVPQVSCGRAAGRFWFSQRDTAICH